MIVRRCASCNNKKIGVLCGVGGKYVLVEISWIEV
jgi:hypothetical protein